MEKTTIVKFELRDDYFDYGQNDAMHGIFDSSYVDRTIDARLSYLSGWSSVPLEKRKRCEGVRVI